MFAATAHTYSKAQVHFKSTLCITFCDVPHNFMQTLFIAFTGID